MCVAIPARIVEIINTVPLTARVDIAGRVDRCCLTYLPEAKVGDYVLVQSGFAVELLDAEDAAETLAAFAAIGAMDPDMFPVDSVPR
jgi:hydrogenase expression/formation protein HypC